MTNPRTQNRFRSHGANGWPLLLAVAVAVTTGCSTPKYVELREVPKNPLSSTLSLMAPSGPKPSERTMQLLNRYDLAGGLDGDPQQLLADFEAEVAKEKTADKIYALAELAYLGGKKSETKDEKVALDLYGSSVMHSFTYLFDPELEATRNPYDPQYRGASDIYNTALEGAMRLVQKQGELKPGCTHTIQTATRKIDITVTFAGSACQNNDFDHFEFVSDYQLQRLRNRFVTYGLGVPLIAVRKGHSEENPHHQFYPRDLSFPVTAFLRVVGYQPGADGGKPGRIQAVLEMYYPLETTDIEVAGRRVPLQSDLSTPLAHFLSQESFDESKLATLGLLDPGTADDNTGLYMLEPYQPGKIPVVMVHGLWSSPVTWMQMFNDLRVDPQIRENYQFWFYLYPTGKPFWFSAAQFREELARVRSTFDPHGVEPALTQTVLVGHSMGGLVSKLQAIESKNDFWDLVATQPFETVEADEATRVTLASTLFFRSDPTVRRIVTIGTPHRAARFQTNSPDSQAES